MSELSHELMDKLQSIKNKSHLQQELTDEDLEILFLAALLEEAGGE